MTVSTLIFGDMCLRPDTGSVGDWMKVFKLVISRYRSYTHDLSMVANVQFFDLNMYGVFICP